MSNTGTRFKLSALTLAMIAGGASHLAYAQEESEVEVPSTQTSENAADAEDNVGTEVIKVEGFRGSLFKALNEKRFSDTVSDSIFAEDIGKSTDQNIADALGRVTGVTVQSVDGEGSRITVRGANPNENIITLNGVQLGSSDFNQSVDLSSLSSDILSRITVKKTASADDDEGSLGGTVELATARPLEISENLRSITLQGRYNDFSEKSNYKLSGSFSQSFFDDTVGILVTAFDETLDVRRDQFSVGNWRAQDVRIARDLDGNIISNTKAITPSGISYQLWQNTRDRRGFTTTLQWLPTDSTDITLDVTSSKQNVANSFDQLNIASFVQNLENLEAGVPHSNQLFGREYIPDFSDPQQDWWTVDTDNHTIVKAINRFADGGFNNSSNEQEVTNNVFTLNIKQEITDSFRVEAQVSSAETELEQPLSFNLNLIANGATPATKLQAGPFGTPHTGIDPAGFDCTSGVCNAVVSTGVGSQLNPNTPWDNRGVASFNPSDLRSIFINLGINGTEQTVTDEIQTAEIDFDWDLDFAGITTVEFGAKYTKREKFVDNQAQRFTNTNTPIEVLQYDPDGTIIGTRLVAANIGLGNISADNLATGEEFPYSDFMQDLGFDLQGSVATWPLLSQEDLLARAFAEEELSIAVDDSQTRRAEVESQAAYLKFNFAYFDDRLSGNVGVRWVRTTLETLGSSGFQFDNSEPVNRRYDPFLFATLRDVTNQSLSPCEFTNVFEPNPNAWRNRIDGTGWDRNGTNDDPSDDTRIPVDPAGYPCFDEGLLQGNLNEFTANRHIDITRQQTWQWGDDPSQIIDNTLVVFPTAGDNEYDLFLPSLSLNYQVRDDLIGRFGLSKTMSRPNFEAVRAGFSGGENIWAGQGQLRGGVAEFNPKLNPQESVNIDLSIEWYFNPTGLLSVALFRKDMTNFLETELRQGFIDDLRRLDTSVPYDTNNLFKDADRVRADWAANPELLTGLGPNACFPHRANFFDVTGNPEWMFDDSDLTEWCAIYNSTRQRNGDGAVINGIEIGYQQNFDFLPSFWSGLGVTANYTYQESKLDAEEGEDAEKFRFPRELTPEHTYNATVFWEQDGHQLRLAYRANSEQLAQRTFGQGALWLDGTESLDFSATYNLSENVDLTFNAINLTDDAPRQFFTSRTFEVLPNGDGTYAALDESNIFETGAYQGRTQTLSKTGRIYRLGIRAKF